MLRIRKTFPLTYQQKAVWYLNNYYNGTNMWNLPLTITFKEDVDFLLLEQAINIVIEKNDSLRLRFTYERGEICQYISDYKKFNVEYYDFSENPGDLDKWLSSTSEVPFEFMEASLFYFAMFKNKHNSGFLMNIHHIIADGWSFTLIINEVVRIYYDLKNNRSVSAEKNPSFIKFLDIEKNYLNSCKVKIDGDFWKEVFNTIPDPVTLKTIEPPKNIRSKRILFTIPGELSMKIYDFCKINKTSVFRLFLTALYLYVSMETSKKDIILGIAFHNRLEKELEKIIGMFVNIIAVRILQEENEDFYSLLKKVGEKIKLIQSHGRYPYELLIRELSKMFVNKEIFFDIVMVQYFKNYFDSRVKVDFNSPGSSANALTLSLGYDYKNIEKPEIELIVDYQTELFNPSEVHHLFENILSIIKNKV